MVSPRMVLLVAGFLGALEVGCDAGDKSRFPTGTGAGGSGGAPGATASSGPTAGTAGAGGAIGTTTSTTTASANTSATSTTSSTSGGLGNGLHVEGNKLVDNGATVRLLGVDRSGSEYSCIQSQGMFDGPVDQNAVNSIKSWHVNTVRVPLNEDCWLDINGAPGQFSGSMYQQAIAGFVTLLRQAGMYVILDLHWNAGGTNKSTGQQEMADADHGPAFWTSVASMFKTDQGILFDLYNEPHDIPWACWLSGGCQTAGWTVAGMQQLLDAVRATGALNVVMAGGVAYASDLTGWLGNKPNDSAGNLAASFHTYNFTGCADTTCWTQQIQPVADVVPVITGELGENDCGQGYIDGYMTWADTAGVSYLGWAWNTANCSTFPALITDYSGTATGFGAGLQAHLATVNP
jgi:endoglucanase